MQKVASISWPPFLRHQAPVFARTVYTGWPYAAFVALHGLAILVLVNDAKPVSFSFLVAAPLIASAACFMHVSRKRTRQGWTELAIAMLLWAGGMATNMAIDLLIASPIEAPGISMLLYVLYGVPLIFAAASPAHEQWYIRAVDGIVALTLGVLFFVHTFSLATLVSASDEGVSGIRWMFDLENGFIAVFAFIRWRATADPSRRALFRALTLFAGAYLAVAAFINHVASQVDFGTVADLAIDLPFLLLAALATKALPTKTLRRDLPSPGFVLAVRAGSPLMLTAMLLVVACVLLHRATGFAALGFIVATLGSGVRNILAQMRGIAEQDRLDALSRIDGLTGLPNRRQFDETFHREWSRARRSETSIAMLMIDIDHFKLLNDGLGHLAGDERLREVGQELASCASRGEDFVGRFGGEEFAVILPGASEASAEALAEKMRKAVVARSLPTPAAPGVVTISIGLAWQGKPDADDPALLVAAADRALYQAKQQGRNCVRRHSALAA